MPEAITTTRSIDQGCPRPPIRSRYLERLSSSFVAQVKASQAAPSFLALRLQSWFEDCLAVLVMAAHSAPRRPPRYSGRASRRRRTAYHCFGLRDDRAGLPDGRRDVYGEAYEEGECDRRSTDQSENASGHASLPIRISPSHSVRVQDPNVDLDQSRGRACEGVDKNASKPQWKTASST
jgi:hypothetical protein